LYRNWQKVMVAYPLVCCFSLLLADCRELGSALEPTLTSSMGLPLPYLYPYGNCTVTATKFWTLIRWDDGKFFYMVDHTPPTLPTFSGDTNADAQSVISLVFGCDNLYVSKCK